MELTIGDDLKAWATIEFALPGPQREIIKAISMCSDLIQVYCATQQKIFWDMTGRYGRIPHPASVKALIRKNIITPTISNKEWEVQMALGVDGERVWKINPSLFEPLINAICLIRTTQEKLKAGGIFK